MKPLSKVKIKWSANFAYAIGLITTDGNLSSDGRHLDFTSKDKDQITNFMQCLGIKNKICLKRSGYANTLSFRIQFSDVNFYNFLLKIGLTPRKSKTLSIIHIPNKYFFDFLRGHFDGDGTFYSYWDKRWKSSFMFYVAFISASFKHINWLRNKISSFLHIKGHLTQDGNKLTYQLKYAKKDSLVILKQIYKSKKSVFLKRKHLKVRRALAIMGQSVG